MHVGCLQWLKSLNTAAAGRDGTCVSGDYGTLFLTVGCYYQIIIRICSISAGLEPALTHTIRIASAESCL